MDQANYGKILSVSDNIQWVQYDDFSFDLIKESQNESSINPVDNYIEGLTLDGKNIYIYSCHPFSIHKGLTHLHTSGFLIGNKIDKDNISGLRFSGGTLDSLFSPRRLDINYKNNEYIVNSHDDSIKKSFTINGNEYIITILSVIKEVYALGTSLNNDEVRLEITANNGIKLGEIEKVYNAVNKMCQFLTFRKNVDFAKVELLQSETYDEKTFDNNICELHVKKEFEITTNKHRFQCISFEEIGENIDTLLRGIFEEKDNKPYFNLDFLPENDKDYQFITSAKIRNICTCLECEANLQKIPAKDDKNLKNLIIEVKNLIKKHKKSDDRLDEKTYSLIFGSINHWDLSASDKIKGLFRKYYEILLQTRCFHYSIESFENAIDSLIKYRNTTTHGNYMQVTGNHAETAANLINLIYISRLDRIGVAKETIQKIICRGTIY